MPTGAITSHIDVAQLVLYAFFLFFIGLVIYLRREDRREGYPLTPDVGDLGVDAKTGTYPSPARPKAFRFEDGETIWIPSVKPEPGEIAARPADRAPGSPLLPTGDPMLDGVGPAAYALRSDKPDHTFEGEPRIVPLRVATDFSVDSRDPDPVGMAVVGADGEVAGSVVDVWIDRAEFIARYFEVEVPVEGAETPNRALLPVPLTSQINAKTRQIKVQCVMARHFATAPGLKNPDEVTLLEEDRISAYFASGHLYAHPSRQEPLV